MLPLHEVALDDVERYKNSFLWSQTTANDTKYLQIYNKRVIAPLLVNIFPRWDIYGRMQARVLRYPNSEQYSPISVQ